jgi:hypothetical protein
LLAPWRWNKQALDDALNSLDFKGTSAEVKEQFQHDKEMLLGPAYP